MRQFPAFQQFRKTSIHRAHVEQPAQPQIVRHPTVHEMDKRPVHRIQIGNHVFRQLRRRPVLERVRLEMLEESRRRLGVVAGVVAQRQRTQHERRRRRSRHRPRQRQRHKIGPDEIEKTLGKRERPARHHVGRVDDEVRPVPVLHQIAKRRAAEKFIVVEIAGQLATAELF